MSYQSFNPETGHLSPTSHSPHNSTNTPSQGNNNGGWWAFGILLIAFIGYIIAKSNEKQTQQTQNYNSQYSQPAYPIVDTVTKEIDSPAHPVISTENNATVSENAQSDTSLNNETENTNQVDFTGKRMIVQVEKTYFHDEPSLVTKRKGYLEKGEVVTISESQNGFGRCIFTNSETQITTEGWLQLSDLYVNE